MDVPNSKMQVSKKREQGLIIMFMQEYLTYQYQLDMSGEPNDFEQGTLELCDCSLVQLAKALQDYSNM